MKTPAAIIALLSSLPFLQAQETVRIIGEVSDGTPPPPAPPKVLPDLPVLASHRIFKDGRHITIERVAMPPDGALPQDRRSGFQPLSPYAPPPDGTLPQDAEGDTLEAHAPPADGDGTAGAVVPPVAPPPPLCYVVSAKVVDGKATLVEWWSMVSGEKARHSCWSNLDWRDLEGFHNFEGRGRAFTFLPFVQGVSTADLQKLREAGREVEIPEIPAALPALDGEGGGARYLMVSGDEGDEGAMEFMETIHALHDAEKARLAAARAEREKNRLIREAEQEELRKNPPPKKDIRIQYWTNPR